MRVNTKEGRIPQIRTQKIGDAEISYLSYEGEGPPLILLHATGFLPWLWHPIAQELADSYHVFVPFYCDHRESDPENGGLKWITLAEDLSRFCKELHLEKPFLAGHSMGATVAVMAHAACGVSAAGMVLIEPIFLPPEFFKRQISLDQHRYASKAIRRKNFWRNREEALSYFHSRPLFQNWDEEILELYLSHGLSEQDGGLRLTCSPQHEAALFMGGIHDDPWPLLSRISCPVLIVEGEESEPGKIIDLDRARTLIPDCAYHWFGGAGHLIPMEYPGEATRLIRNFFRPLRPKQKRAAAGIENKSAVGQTDGKKLGPGAKPEPRSIAVHNAESTDSAHRRARSGRGSVRRNRIFEREEARMAKATKAPAKPAKAAAKKKAPVKAKAKVVAKPKAAAKKTAAKAKPAKKVTKKAVAKKAPAKAKAKTAAKAKK
jgi:lipase